MKKIITFLVFTLCFSETKIGWVDSQYIFNQLDETREAQVELEKKQRSLEAELMNMISRGDSLYQAFEKQAPLMGAQMQKSKQDELVEMQKQIELFQMQKLGPEGELYSFYAQLIAPIEKKILDSIAKIGNERGYDYILDSSRGGIVHALDSHKLDEFVLENLRKGTISE